MGYMQTTTAQDKPVKLFPEGVPGGADTLVEKKSTEGNRVAGENVLRITNVNQPTITIYQPPQEFAAGSAVIVCPGGGYNLLAYDLKGELLGAPRFPANLHRPSSSAASPALNPSPNGRRFAPAVESSSAEKWAKME